MSLLFVILSTIIFSGVCRDVVHVVVVVILSTISVNFLFSISICTV